MPLFEKHYCLYCGAVTSRKVKVAEATYVTRKREKVMTKAPQYIDVCDEHYAQVQAALGEKIKRHIRPKVLKGQTEIGDFL